MTFQSVPDTAVVEIILTTSGSTNWGPAQHNLNFRRSGGYIQDDLEDLAQAVGDWWSVQVMPFLSADIALVQVRARGLANDPDFEGFMLTGLPQAGSIGANVTPSSVAAVISFGTGQVGRSTRGRVYIAGMADTAVNDDEISLTVRGGLIDAFALELAGALPAGWEHVVVSRFHNGIQRSTALTYPVTTYTMTSTQIGSQRRRLHRYG